MAGKLTYCPVHLQVAAGDVERNVRAVDHPLQYHQVVGDDVLAVVVDKDPVAVEVDGVLV